MFALLVFFGGAIYWMLFSLKNVPKGNLVQSVESPDGSYTLNTYVSENTLSLDAARGELVNEKHLSREQSTGITRTAAQQWRGSITIQWKSAIRLYILILMKRMIGEKMIIGSVKNRRRRQWGDETWIRWTEQMMKSISIILWLLYPLYTVWLN